MLHKVTYVLVSPELISIDMKPLILSLGEVFVDASTESSCWSFSPFKDLPFNVYDEMSILYPLPVSMKHLFDSPRYIVSVYMLSHVNLSDMSMQCVPASACP